jgi:predicted regulator of Ras-like GTPase activity (Roadblock/LC7/MglB family)
MIPSDRHDLDWLVTDFTERVADVAHAIVVSADGVPLALSEDIPVEHAQQLSAITSGLASLMLGAARIFDAGPPTQALVEMEGGLMLVKAVADGSCLAVLAAPECDTSLVSYEMTLLVEAVGEVISPPARTQLTVMIVTRGPARHAASAIRLNSLPRVTAM